jgi:predicted transcriptional regulator
MRSTIAIALCLLLASTVSAQTPVNATAPDFTLQDQFERTVSLRQDAGRIVVLIASDKEGSTQNPAWIKAIRARYGDRIGIRGIADVSSVPFFLKGKVRSDFRKDADSILLDWKGEVFRSYGFVKGVSNVVVIDRRSVIRYLHAGSAESAALDGVFRALDKALEHGEGNDAGAP